MSDLTHKELMQLLHYNPYSGNFFWVHGRNQQVPAGSLAGNVDKSGYVRIKINGRNHAAHRLAMFYMYGEWPQYTVDHKDMNPSNNRFSNLRDVTSAEQARNTKSYHRAKGYYFDNTYNAWRVNFRYNGQKYTSGGYATEAEVARATTTLRNKVRREMRAA